MDEAIKNIAAIASRDVAGGAFRQAMRVPEIPTIAESVLRPIQALVEKWERNAPTGKHLVVMMQTADAQFINMIRLRPAGGLMFQAEGNIDGTPCMILAHVNQLNMFFQYQDDSKISHRVRGFAVEIPETRDAAPESEASAPDSK